MKPILLLFFSMFVFHISYGQEICDNGIDDDGDGLIDLNDDECECEGMGGALSSLIPNPSFEEMDCCPTSHSQLDCATTWIQASGATSDYYNTCDFTVIVGEGVTSADITDIPDGEAWVGYWTSTGYLEYIGACLDGPLLSGVEYTLNFHTAWGKGNADHEFAIYGTTDCGDLPWGGFSCPVGVGSWELLTSQLITYPMDGTWQEITITFTPTSDMTAIAFGGLCAGESPMRYTYIDDLTLIDSESYSAITESGNWCDGDLMLEATTDTSGGTWQWYLEGVALIGETAATIDVMPYGFGVFSAVYSVGENCLRADYMVEDEEGISANFEFSPVCVGEVTAFTNTSIYDGGIDPDWEWDFGDGGVSTAENPDHTYTDPGIYTVQLIAINDVGCNDTIEIEITVDPAPIANFEFIVNGISSQDGSTGGCIASVVSFNDLSTVIAPGIITDWDWDFGDGDGSDLENPDHLYDVPGDYTITLTVTTTNGCTSSYELAITMLDGLALDIIANEPNCYGFTDGSVTVNVIGGGDDLIFEITDESGTILNEDNSNTANSLGEGWYYIEVNDESSCSGIDSIFLSQPGVLAIDIDVVDPLCYGDETGTAVVTDVYNYTGSPALISYIWNPNPGGNGGIGEDSTWAMGAGDYTVTINDENGCSKVFDFTVNQPEELIFVEFGFEHAYCRLHEYQSGNGVVFGAASGGTPDYDYSWENLDNGETTISSTWGGLNPAYYVCTTKDANGCILKDTLLLDSLNPIADFTINSLQLNMDHQGIASVDAEFINNSLNYANPNNPDADTVFFWNLNTPYAAWQISHDIFETFDTTYGPKGQTYYVDVCLVVMNKNGCTDTACKMITIYEPVAFDNVNIFSPNNDGLNDEFTFEFRSASIAEFHCVIVDRWGVVVGELNSISEGWDGTDLNGDPCTDGVYFYTYEAVTDNSTKLAGQGTVQLVGSK